MQPLSASSSASITESLWQTVYDLKAAIRDLAKRIYAFVRSLFDSCFPPKTSAPPDLPMVTPPPPDIDEDYVMVESPEEVAKRHGIDLEHLLDISPLPEPPETSPEQLQVLLLKHLPEQHRSLQQGLESFVKACQDDADLARAARHLVYFISQEECDAIKRENCLVDLSLAGSKGDAIDMLDAATICYKVLAGKDVASAAKASVYEILKCVRANIVSGSKTIALQKGAVWILGSLSLPISWVPWFFEVYNRRQIIETVVKAVNGDRARLPFSLGTYAIKEWLSQQLSPEMIYEQGSKIIKSQAIEFFLQSVGVLKGSYTALR